MIYIYIYTNCIYSRPGATRELWIVKFLMNKSGLVLNQNLMFDTLR